MCRQDASCRIRNSCQCSSLYFLFGFIACIYVSLIFFVPDLCKQQTSDVGETAQVILTSIAPCRPVAETRPGAKLRGGSGDPLPTPHPAPAWHAAEMCVILHHVPRDMMFVVGYLEFYLDCSFALGTNSTIPLHQTYSPCTDNLNNERNIPILDLDTNPAQHFFLQQHSRELTPPK